MRGISSWAHGHLIKVGQHVRMAITHAATARLVDPNLPEVRSLLVRGVPDPLKVAMAASDVKVTHAEAVQITWWPGESITVRYRAELAGGGLDGPHQLVAVAGVLPEGVAVVEGDEGRVGVWRVPHDPFLPGLKYALDPVAAGQLLTGLGFRSDRCQPRLVSYRPGNRAVVAVTGLSGSVFLKVVAPSRVERLHAAHRLIASRLPIPTSLGMDPDLGLVALQELPGITLRQALVDRQPVPDPTEIMGLPDGLPDPLSKKVSKSPLERIPALIAMLGSLVSDQGDRLASLEVAIGGEANPVSVPVHGDFYEAQVMVRSGRVVGMLDVDTFGWGRPGDDPATLLGHLAVLDQSSPNSQVRTWASQLLKRCDAVHDPVDLRRRVAAVIVALAPGPFRVQRTNWPALTRARLDLAARWCQSAARVAGRDEHDLISISGPAPVGVGS